MTRFNLLPVSEQRAAIDRGDAAILDIVAASIDRIEETQRGDGAINAMIAHDRESALAGAESAEQRRLAGDDGVLVGIPVAVKDNFATRDLPTTCASRMLAGFVAAYDATAVRRLGAAGAVVVGKTNMDEFAMGSSTETSAFGPTRNPARASCVPGGSSGGSAAAVAAGICRVALGSDTAGSTRQPASFCGVVGVKPTYGRVSRFGLVSLASSLDHVGILGSTVGDSAIALRAIAGVDPLDSTSAHLPVPDYQAAGEEPIVGVVVGVPREYFPEELHPGVRERCEQTLELLRGAGATIREISLPHTRFAVPVYHVIAAGEASSNLARYDGVRYGSTDDELRGQLYDTLRARAFGTEVTRRILLGTSFLADGDRRLYGKAMQVRTLVAADFSDAFGSGVDLVFTPTTPAPAFELGGKSTAYSMYQSDVFTVAANLAGLPAISLPIGRTDGLPVGGQIIAPHFREQRMFSAAFALERALGSAAVV